MHFFCQVQFEHNKNMKHWLSQFFILTQKELASVQNYEVVITGVQFKKLGVIAAYTSQMCFLILQPPLSSSCYLDPLYCVTKSQ